MRFLNALLWESIQNTPVIVLFVFAVWHWTRRRKTRSMVCAIGGAVVGSLLIRFTEPAASGYHEPVEVTAVNAVSMSLLQFLFAVYLGTEANWSNWRMDVFLGAGAGVALAVAQGLAAPDPPVIGILLHSLALASAGALVLVGIRKLKGQDLTSALASAALLAIVMTLFISLIDYGYFLIW